MNEHLTESAAMPDALFETRTFLDINGEISGRSVVIQNEKSPSQGSSGSERWPCSLSDYMKDYIGRPVIVEYIFNNMSCARRGRLKVVGTNFVGINTAKKNSLFLLELGAIKSVHIFD